MSALISIVLTACSDNKGAPLPPHKEGLQLAEKSGWQAELTWEQNPRYSDSEFLEMRGLIKFRDESGNVPASVEAVSLVADMPLHNHGTGNIQPIVTASSSSPANFQFKNLYFTMTGPWRIKIVATVNGKSDYWFTTVEVGN